MLCEILKLQTTLGVHEKNQIRSQKGKEKGYFVDYQKNLARKWWRINKNQ